MDTLIKCFISSPGDTSAERKICVDVITELNKTICKDTNFKVEALMWEKDTYPAFDVDAQSVINKQIGSGYHIFIGIMSGRFGTKTNRAGSGTEEEFNIAYHKFLNKEPIDILFYFKDPLEVSIGSTDLKELSKVQDFRKKISELGGLYKCYENQTDFEKKLRSNLTNLLLEKFRSAALKVEPVLEKTITDDVLKILEGRLNKSLIMFNGQPKIWVEPIISTTSEISSNPDENYDSRVDVTDVIAEENSTFIKAPPQFGLTCLSHYLILEAYKKGKFWVYLDSSKTKPHNVHNAVKNEAACLSKSVDEVQCILLDGWSLTENGAFKKLKNLTDAYPNIRIIVMETIDETKFNLENETEPGEIERDFKVLHLLALSRTLIRKIVSDYNKAKDIGDENSILSKITSDLEVLNIHRTPHNCLTLLKVSEKHFDESPINRTQMIEMVLFVLFNLEDLPTYKSKPDLKDCEYILGMFCEGLIRENNYAFTRDFFLNQLKKFCSEKLLDIEVEIVFDILDTNNIIILKDDGYTFRSSFWIFYFGAKRMHQDAKFSNYIFESRKYANFPEIIEFFTGIDRSRDEALRILQRDIKETTDIVYNKLGLPDNINPFVHAQWNPTVETVDRMAAEIGEGVLNSKLPEEIKDRFADKEYDQIRPYNQTIQTFFEEFALYALMQRIRATSRALRNSDYVDINLKKQVLSDIMRAWQQISKVLFALTPILAAKGRADFEGAGFRLVGDFGDSVDEKMKRILVANPTNIVGLFKSDLYSSKMGPLLFDLFEKEPNPIMRHHLGLLIVFERPRNWKLHIENYIISLNKNSYFLYDIVNSLRVRYRYAFADTAGLREIEYLIKMGFAKHHFGEKKPGLDKIAKISNNMLPKREIE